ncbi:MAG: cupin fold metalloprotein, WbuC family [Spirochaetae bacterium HGW-Spirochaetae-1]|nr:MAG: cupin fold metalloprotein, WbuC family [Spirochaetae bacterium HGW-Spirochaetae-1]
MKQEQPYRIVSLEELRELSTLAASLPRLRKNLNLHKPEDRVQRFFNALEPGTYVRPHRHLDPPKVETFVIISGSFLTVIFDDDGSVTDVYRIDRDGGAIAIDILPGTWHSVVCERPGTVYFEVKDGPYVALTDKDFAPWAPAEGSDGAPSYLARLEREALLFLEREGHGGG